MNTKGGGQREYVQYPPRTRGRRIHVRVRINWYVCHIVVKEKRPMKEAAAGIEGVKR
jgi:hypothetical protein